MIRLRCETGARPRTTVDWKVPLQAWLAVAQSCARFQAHSVLATGRRRVDFSKVRELHGELDLLILYEADILELIAWEEQDRTGVLTRIKSADVSKEAARALVAANLLPEALLTSLLAPDLLDQETDSDVLNVRQTQALARWSDYDMSSSSYTDVFARGLPMRNVPRLPQHCFASV